MLKRNLKLFQGFLYSNNDTLTFTDKTMNSCNLIISYFFWLSMLFSSIFPTHLTFLLSISHTVALTYSHSPLLSLSLIPTLYRLSRGFRLLPSLSTYLRLKIKTTQQYSSSHSIVSTPIPLPPLFALRTVIKIILRLLYY